MKYQEKLNHAASAVLRSSLGRHIVERLMLEACEALRWYKLDIQGDALSWEVTDLAVKAALVITDPREPALDLRLEAMLTMMPFAGPGPKPGDQEGRAVLAAGIYDKKRPGVNALERVTWATVHVPDCPETASLRGAADLEGTLAEHVRQHYDAMDHHKVNRYCCRQLAADFQASRIRAQAERTSS